MFWIVLLIMFLCTIPTVVLLGWLGMLIGEMAYLVGGFLLLAGIVTAFVVGYQKLTGRVDNVGEKLELALIQLWRWRRRG